MRLIYTQTHIQVCKYHQLLRKYEKQEDAMERARRLKINNMKGS